MAAARFAAVFVALLSIELSAQPAPHGSITIQVTDPAGTMVPRAQIEIDPSFSKPGSVFLTDSQGLAVLDLSEGTHVLSIDAPGFAKWMRSINVQSGSLHRSVVAKLQIMPFGDPVIVEFFEPDLPLSTPGPIFLPLQPLFNLDPLPFVACKETPVAKRFPTPSFQP